MASDIEQLVFAISADVTQMKRALQRGQGDIKLFADSANRTFSTINGGAMAGNFNKSLRAMQNDTRNLTFQMNDLAQGLAMGTSGFTLMMQQGSQVTQALGGAGLMGTVKMLGSSLKAMINPASAAVFALIWLAGAARDYFTEVKEGGDEAAKKYEEETKLLSSVAKEYEGLMPLVEKYAKLREEAASTKERKEATELAITAEYEALAPLQKKVEAAMNDINAELARGAVLTEEQKKKVADWEAAANALNASFADHSLTVEKVQAAYDAMNQVVKDTDGSYAELRATMNQLFIDAAKRAAEDAKAREAGVKVSEKDVEIRKKGLKAVEEMSKIGQPALTEMGKLTEAYGVAMEAVKEAIAAGNTELAETLKMLAQAALLAGQIAIGDLSIAGIADMGVSGLSGDYAKKVAQVESGGRADAKNPMSSASGMFQFINSTFLAVARTMKEFAGMTDAQIMAQKNNVAVQERVFNEFTNRNAEYLTRHGHAINDATLYMAHVMGPGGANAVLAASKAGRGNQPISSIVGAESARLNPSLLGNRTVNEVIAAFVKKMNVVSADIATEGPRKSNEAAREEAEIRGQLNAGIKESTRQEAYRLKLAELNRDAAKEASETGVATSAERRAAMEKEAQAYGKLQGQLAATEDAKSFEEGIKNLEARTAAIVAEQEAAGNTGKAIDDLTYKREYAQKVQELQTLAAKDGTAATAAEMEVIERAAAAYARAEASKTAYNAATKDAQTFEDAIRRIDERTAAIEAEERAAGNLGQVIDELTYKREYAATVQELTSMTSRDGTAATEAETAAIHKSADAFARAQAAKEGFANASKAAAASQQQFAQQVSSIAQSAIGGFISDLRKGVDAGEAFANMLDKIIDGLINMALEMLFSKQMMGGLFGGGGGVGAVVGHKGGRVGTSLVNDGRKFSPALWAGAPRYAKGGIAGLKPGEVPAILHRGELIIPTSGLKGGGGKMTGDTINTSLGDVSIDMSKTGVVAGDNERAKSFASNVQRLIQMEMVRESRPGGLLRRVPT